jgi:hypothetical protein
LKKRTKKLLLFGFRAGARDKASGDAAHEQKFFASFFQKRRPCYPQLTSERCCVFTTHPMILRRIYARSMPTYADGDESLSNLYAFMP